MPTIVQKEVKGRPYYYLQHTVRTGGRPDKRELYLGNRIPRDIERMKRDFLHDIYKERWHPTLEQIRSGYAREARLQTKTGAEREAGAFATHFTYDTQRIEGSTLTLRETADLLERGISPRGRPIADVKEAEAHRDLFHEVLHYRKDPTLQTLFEWHWMLFRHTRPDIAGKLRQHQVQISGSRFVPPLPVEVQPLLREFFRWHGREKNRLHPVELAALAHLKFVTIHPFADGNGRISRLLMNHILHRGGYPMLNIPYAKRSGYYRALERAQVGKAEGVFVGWVTKRYVEENSRFIER